MLQPPSPASLLLLNTSIVSSFLLYDSGLRFVNGALVLGLALGGGLGCGALSWPFAIWGGRASYAIYILHIPILWWYKRTPAYLDLPPVWAGFIYVAIVLAVSFAVCAWYERAGGQISSPEAQRLVRTRPSRRTRTADRRRAF